MACIPPLSSAWMLLHVRVMEMKKNKAKAHILYLQVSFVFPWVMRTEDHGQQGAKGLGWGQVCVDMCPTSLVFPCCMNTELCTAAYSQSPRFPMRTLLGGAAPPLLWITLHPKGSLSVLVGAIFLSHIEKVGGEEVEEEWENRCSLFRKFLTF